MFRLFPSGTNSYHKGAEVLNSYGRRANDNLLLDYGFAMLDNPWETVELTCGLSPSAALFERRKELLRASGQHPFRCVDSSPPPFIINVIEHRKATGCPSAEVTTAKFDSWALNKNSAHWFGAQFHDL